MKFARSVNFISSTERKLMDEKFINDVNSGKIKTKNLLYNDHENFKIGEAYDGVDKPKYDYDLSKTARSNFENNISNKVDATNAAKKLTKVTKYNNEFITVNDLYKMNRKQRRQYEQEQRRHDKAELKALNEAIKSFNNELRQDEKTRRNKAKLEKQIDRYIELSSKREVAILTKQADDYQKEADKKAKNTEIIVKKHKDLKTNKVTYSYEVLEKTDEDIKQEREIAKKSKQLLRAKKKKGLSFDEARNKVLNKNAIPTATVENETIEEPAKTTLIKRKVKVWDDNAWGKGRGGNKEIMETLTKEELDSREEFIKKYNQDIKDNNINEKELTQYTLVKVMHNRKVKEVKDLKLDAISYHNAKKERGIYNLLNVIYTSNKHNTDFMDLILDRIEDNIDDLGKYFEDFELVALYESKQDKMDDTYSKFFEKVLKYDLDDVYKGRTIREILMEVGVSNV